MDSLQKFEYQCCKFFNTSFSINIRINAQFIAQWTPFISAVVIFIKILPDFELLQTYQY